MSDDLFLKEWTFPAPRSREQRLPASPPARSSFTVLLRMLRKGVSTLLTGTLRSSPAVSRTFRTASWAPCTTSCRTNVIRITLRPQAYWQAERILDNLGCLREAQHKSPEKGGRDQGRPLFASPVPRTLQKKLQRPVRHPTCAVPSAYPAV
jgi:hypothetical protein